VAGTRGGVGRIAAMVIGLAVVLVLALAAEARAGIYQVVQCGWGVGAELGSPYPAIEGASFSLDLSGCTAPPGSAAAGMGFEGAVAPNGVRGLARARWTAPSGTSFTAAHVSWSGAPQAGVWQGLAADVEGQFHILASSWTSVVPTRLDLAIESGASAFEAWLQCLMEGPLVGCTRSVASTMRLWDVDFALEDPVAPQARLGAVLAAAGWHRGTAALGLSASDVGAGVATAGATIDGAPVLAAVPACAVETVEGVVRGTRLQPCPPTATGAIEIDTTRFADGIHTLRGCATDFAGSEGCASDTELEIDNSPPTAYFVAAEEGQVAATVGDRYSGPASGKISLRRADTEAWTDLDTNFEDDGDGKAALTARLPDLSAGTYLFRVTATDAAGNTVSVQQQVSGSAAEVRRQIAGGHGGEKPGKAPAPRGGGGPPVAYGRATRLSAHLGSAGSHLTVDYGAAVTVRGRLTDTRGAGLGGRSVVVVARPTAKIGQAPERRHALADRAGHFEVLLPAGTSRRVTVAFKGGDGLAATGRRSLVLRVRGAVSLKVKPPDLRTGESMTLRGRVSPGPARVPRRGKTVAIQYLERASGDWRPALVVRTDSRGRFKARYRFRYITGEARIRLRATALPEAGWPYAAGSSPPVTVEVHGG
jgi:hypothetical protein